MLQQQKVFKVKSKVLSTTTNEDCPAFNSVNSNNATDWYRTRDGKFERLLLEPVVNLQVRLCVNRQSPVSRHLYSRVHIRVFDRAQELQQLVWNGCPPGRRSICWKLLLVSRNEYEERSTMHVQVVDHFLLLSVTGVSSPEFGSPRRGALSKAPRISHLGTRALRC